MSWKVNKAPERGRVLTAEEAALRHIAMLVARGAPTPEIFQAVAEQVARILDRPWVGVMRYDSAHSFVVVATWGEHPFPAGSRWPLDGPSTFESVLRTGRPAAILDYAGLSGTVAEAAQKAGIVGGIGAPIIVDGATWGLIAVPATRAAPIPEGAEVRLNVFTELVATAISNAQARQDLQRLADEQAAGRRVATLVARGIGPEGVFRAVAGEVGVLFGADVSAIVRFEDDGMVTVLGDVGGPHAAGKRVSLDEGYVVHRVRETGRSARFDTDEPSAADMPSLVRALGIRSAVASPIVVEGELWGAITAVSVESPLPASAERRLTEFTELVATAVANTHAREHVTALVQEQAALRRVATLVAHDAPPAKVFEAVAAEVGELLDANLTVLGRYDDDAATAIGSWSSSPEVIPVGTRSSLGGAERPQHCGRDGEARASRRLRGGNRRGR